MKRIALFVALCVQSFVLFGYEVSVDTFVANPGQRVAVPVRFDTVKGASHVWTRMTYDPQVLVLMEVKEGSLNATFPDDFVVVGDEKSGSVSISALGETNVQAEVEGTLATVIFEVRTGTQGLYSDLTVANVKVGEETGLRDVTVANPVKTKNGMVRVMAQSAAVARLEDAQTICADAVLGSVAFKDGDGIQASDEQTAVVVTGAVTTEEAIRVIAPIEGWASGRYELLKTPTTGLQFALVDAPGGWALGSEESNGIVTYFANVNIIDELPIICER